LDFKEEEKDFLSMIEMINSIKDTMTNLPVINTEEVAEIVYTSGSLGRAKGVMLSQKNISSNLMAMR
jgi:long-chain acyl-CoA synthetase